MAPIAAPAAGRFLLGARSDAERDPDERQLAIARRRGRSEGPPAGRRRARSRGRPCRASRSSGRARGPARRRSRSPGRRRPGARRAASASAPRGPSRRRRPPRSHVADRPDDAERHRLGERVRVGRQERLERMGHRVDPGRRRGGRRQADGQGRIEDRRHGQQRRMADVALAAGRLVGDDRERVRLGAGAGRRRDGDDGPAGRQVGAVVLQVPDGPGRSRRAGRAPWPCPSTSRRRPARRPCPSSPKARSASAPRSTVEAPGFGSTSAKTAGLEAGCGEHAEDAVDDARPADARVGHHEHPRATGRGDHLGESLDRADPEQDPVAQDDLELAVGQRASPRRSRRPCRSRCRGGPSASAGSRTAWNHRSVVAPVGVLEDPDLVEVALVGVGDRVRRPRGARHRR